MKSYSESIMPVSLLNNANTSTNPGSSSPVIASLESSSINNNNNNNNINNNNSNNSVNSDLAYVQHPYSHPNVNALLNNNPSGVLQHFHSQQHQHQQAINNIHANYQINKRFKNDQYEFSNYQHLNSQNSGSNNNNQQIQHSLNENANNASLLNLKKAQQVKYFFFYL